MLGDVLDLEIAKYLGERRLYHGIMLGYDDLNGLDMMIRDVKMTISTIRPRVDFARELLCHAGRDRRQCN